MSDIGKIMLAIVALSFYLGLAHQRSVAAQGWTFDRIAEMINGR